MRHSASPAGSAPAATVKRIRPFGPTVPGRPSTRAKTSRLLATQAAAAR